MMIIETIEDGGVYKVEPSLGLGAWFYLGITLINIVLILLAWTPSPRSIITAQPVDVVRCLDDVTPRVKENKNYIVTLNRNP